MTLTKKEAYKLHYELWDWVYHHPSEYKEDWPQWKFNGGKIETIQDNCFLCEWFTKGRGSCFECPLGSKKDTEDNCKLFYKWQEAKTPKTRKKYAKLIRDIVL